MFNLNRKNIYKNDGYAFTVPFGQSPIIKTLRVDLGDNRFFVSDFSFECRFKFINSGNPTLLRSPLIIGPEGPVTSEQIQLRLDSATLLRLFWRDSGGTIRSMNMTIAYNTWYHCVIVFDLGTEIAVYLNGSKVASNVTNTTLLTNNNLKRITIGEGNTYRAGGQYHGIRLFNKALIASDILLQYKFSANKNKGVDESLLSNLILNLDLNQSNGMPYVEKSENVNAKPYFTDNSKTFTLQNGNAWQPIT